MARLNLDIGAGAAPKKDLIAMVSEAPTDAEKLKVLVSEGGLSIGQATETLDALKGVPTPAAGALPSLDAFAQTDYEAFKAGTAPSGTVQTPLAAAPDPLTPGLSAGLKKVSDLTKLGNTSAAAQALTETTRTAGIPVNIGSAVKNVNTLASSLGVRTNTTPASTGLDAGGGLGAGGGTGFMGGGANTGGGPTTGGPVLSGPTGTPMTTPPPPAITPLSFTPSRTNDPNAARDLAGARAFMQVNPSIQAKRAQQELALQGLQMLRDRLNLGVEQTRQNVVREAPKLLDKARRTLAAAGLTESGGTPGAVERISEEALNRIAQEGERASLQGRQEEQRVGLENRAIDAQVAELLGQVSLDEEGRFTGSLVDSLMQEIQDRDAEFTLRERQLAVEENRILNDLELARYNAQVAAQQGDRNAQLQAQRLAQEKEFALAELNQRKEEYAFEKTKWDEGAQARDLAVQQAQERLTQEQSLFPLEKDAASLKVANERLQQSLTNLQLEAERLRTTILSDKDLGVRAQAQQEFQKKNQEIALIQSQITENNAQAAKANAQSTGEIDPITMRNLSALGVADIGLTQNPQAFLDNARKIQDLLRTDMSLAANPSRLLTEFSNADRVKLRNANVDDTAFYNWIKVLATKPMPSGTGMDAFNQFLGASGR